MLLSTIIIVLFSLHTACAQPRIFNGTNAGTGKYPFVASLRRSATGSHLCGCSIISQKWLLTAAHCIFRKTPKEVNLQYGVTEISPNGRNVVSVSRLVVHEGYNPSNAFIHDIGLIKLQYPISFNEQVQTVRLPKLNQFTAAKTSVVLVGWGLTSGGTYPRHLQEVVLQTFSDEECRRRNNNLPHPTNICAGVPEGGKGQCSGDSGGPLIQNGMQIGIVSWSFKPCAQAPYLGVFTEVSAYVGWIQNVLKYDYGQ